MFTGYFSKQTLSSFCLPISDSNVPKERLCRGLPISIIRTYQQENHTVLELLETLNTLGYTENGSVPFLIWLKNAHSLLSDQPNGTIYKEALEYIQEHTPTKDSKEANAQLNLGQKNREEGYPQKALQAFKSAAKLYRTLLKDRPQMFIQRLAISLSGMGQCHRELGHIQDSYKTYLEASQLYFKWSTDHREILPQYAHITYIMSLLCTTSGHYSEAQAHAEDSIATYDKIVHSKPNVYRSKLAESMHQLSRIHIKVEEYRYALQCIRKVVEIYREQSMKRPSTFLPKLASAVHDLAYLYRTLGYTEEAVYAAQESVKIARKLAHQHHHSDFFLPDLAQSLYIFGCILSEHGDFQKALQVFEEAVQSYRFLSLEDIDYQKDLAEALHHLGCAYSHCQNNTDALYTAQESVGLYVELLENTDAPIELSNFKMSLDGLKTHIQNSKYDPSLNSVWLNGKECFQKLQHNHGDALPLHTSRASD